MEAESNDNREMGLKESKMSRIVIAVVTYALLALACSPGHLHAAETRTPTPEEFREQVRQYSESGKSLEVPRRRPVTTQPPKAVEQFNRALSLQIKKDASPSELREAAALYQAAIDAGISQASNNLALLYLEGKGVKKDVNKALSILYAASQKSDPHADIALAKLYLIGKDVKKDEKKGEWHLNKAAKTGDKNSVKMLAEYKEWKKKNELAMKQFQELVKKSQTSQINPQLSSQPPLATQSSTGFPYQPKTAVLPFSVIPGQPYLLGNKSFNHLDSSSHTTPVFDVGTKGATIVPQPDKDHATIESGKGKADPQPQP